MYVINLVLPKKSSKIWLDRIERTHRVRLRKNNGKSRDLILLKNYNHNPSPSSKVFINEALTILFEASKLVPNKLVNSVWTYDGRIFVKLD